MKKQLLLKATEHNWGLTGPGDWSKVEWRIFRDGSYDIISSFRPSFEAYENEEKPIPTKKKSKGSMGGVDFAKLQEALNREPWRDPAIDVFACDGVAWEIESYKEDGSVEKTSGKLDYIYGHSVLETIVDLLPADGTLYDSSAFVSVENKE